MGGLAVAVSPDGSQVLVSGSSEGATVGHIVVTTAAYAAATGTQQWVARQQELGDPVQYYLAVARTGPQVFVATTAAPNYAADVTLAYDAATGTRQWARTYSVFRKDNTASAIAVSPGGSAVFVTGTFNATGEPHMGTIAYNTATGSVLWNEHYPPCTGPAGHPPSR